MEADTLCGERGLSSVPQNRNNQYPGAQTHCRPKLLS